MEIQIAPLQRAEQNLFSGSYGIKLDKLFAIQYYWFRRLTRPSFRLFYLNALGTIAE